MGNDISARDPHGKDKHLTRISPDMIPLVDEAELDAQALALL